MSDTPSITNLAVDAIVLIFEYLFGSSVASNNGAPMFATEDDFPPHNFEIFLNNRMRLDEYQEPHFFSIPFAILRLRRVNQFFNDAVLQYMKHVNSKRQKVLVFNPILEALIFQKGRSSSNYKIRLQNLCQYYGESINTIYFVNLKFDWQTDGSKKSPPRSFLQVFPEILNHFTQLKTIALFADFSLKNLECIASHPSCRSLEQLYLFPIDFNNILHEYADKETRYWATQLIPIFEKGSKELLNSLKTIIFDGEKEHKYRRRDYNTEIYITKYETVYFNKVEKRTLAIPSQVTLYNYKECVDKLAEKGRYYYGFGNAPSPSPILLHGIRSFSECYFILQRMNNIIFGAEIPDSYSYSFTLCRKEQITWPEILLCKAITVAHGKALPLTLAGAVIKSLELTSVTNSILFAKREDLVMQYLEYLFTNQLVNCNDYTEYYYNPLLGALEVSSFTILEYLVEKTGIFNWNTVFMHQKPSQTILDLAEEQLTKLRSFDNTKRIEWYEKSIQQMIEKGAKRYSQLTKEEFEKFKLIPQHGTGKKRKRNQTD